MSYKKVQVYFFITILIISAVLTLLVFRPYFTLLAFGGVLAILAAPIYRYLLKLFKNATAASFLTVLVVVVAVLIPLVFFTAALTTEVIGLFTDAKSYFDTVSITQFLQANLPVSFHDQIPTVLDESVGVLRTIVEFLSTNLIALFSNLFAIFFGTLVALIALYYLLKDGGRVKKELLALSPLGDEYDELVFRRIIIAVQAVMGGVLVIGVIKGILAALFFWIFGVPAPLFWGTMTGLASFLPIVGSSLITVPAVLYLFLTGDYANAVGLLITSIALIGTIDNFLQPKLVESRTKIHPLLILLSILGGLEFYGFSGFILGPLTLAVTMALIDIYKKEFRNYVERVD